MEELIYGTRATRVNTSVSDSCKGTISWQLGQQLTMFVPHITRKIGIFTKGFIKLSSQFIFSREQSTFVISYISLLRHLTEFLSEPHLFAKSRSTVVKSHCLSRNHSIPSDSSCSSFYFVSFIVVGPFDIRFSVAKEALSLSMK